MYSLTNVCVAPLEESIYLHPWEMHYTLNGVKKKWDYIEIHDSVVVVIYNVTREVLVCVRQFRPAVYLRHIPLEDKKSKINVEKYPPTLGLALEFCAGINDKSMSAEETAKAEVMEETGYDVPLEKLQKIRTYRSNIGSLADEVNMFYAEVEDYMKTGPGGGLAEEGEFIEIVDVPIEEARKICENPNDDPKYCGLLYGLLWFLHFKAPSILKHT